MNGSGLDWTGTELLNCFESTLTFPKIQRMRVGMVEVRFSHIPESFLFWRANQRARGKFCEADIMEVTSS